MKIAVFHPGTQHSWLTVRALQEIDALAWFCTGIYFSRNSFIRKATLLLPKKVRATLTDQINLRFDPLIKDSFVISGAPFEWLKVLAVRMRFKRLERRISTLSVSGFHKRVTGQIDAQKPDAIWGYDGYSLEVFTYAKNEGITCVLDFTTVHPAIQNQIIADRIHSGPEFLNVVPHSAKWISRVQSECEIADLILVGSDFARNSLLVNGVSKEKIRVIPYGYDSSRLPAKMPKQNLPSPTPQPTKFIFVGAVRASKGLGVLIRAFKLIDPRLATLTIVGPRSAEIAASELTSSSNIKYIGKTSRAAVFNWMGDSDCLILPTLFDGGGIVLYEAAAMGLAIIQSEYCGDGVRNDNGLVLSEVTEQTIFEAIQTITNSPDKLTSMKLRSLEISDERSEAIYSKNVANIIQHLKC